MPSYCEMFQLSSHLKSKYNTCFVIHLSYCDLCFKPMTECFPYMNTDDTGTDTDDEDYWSSRKFSYKEGKTKPICYFFPDKIRYTEG